MRSQEDNTFLDFRGQQPKKSELVTEVESRRDILNKDNRKAPNQKEVAAAVIEELLAQEGGI